MEEKLRDIEERLKNAALSAGREPGSVRLVAVSKTYPAHVVEEAIRAGVTILGENYLQEAVEKIEALRSYDAVWHFIGHLQSKKAKHAVKYFDLIHSVDSLKLAREIDKHAGKIGKVQKILVQVNIGEEASKSGTGIDEVEELADFAWDAYGHVDVIVNNAGITHLPKPMEEVTEEEFDRVLAVNAKSVYLMARSFVPAMKARGSGAILNVASTAGLSPRPNLNWYNASKGWMVTATKTMAVELAPKGIRVNALCPVAGETPLLASFMGEDTPEMRAKFISTIPIGRFSTPEDMGNAACYLCSDEASMITGCVLRVDGGRCI